MNADIRICFVGDSLVNGIGDEHCLGWAGRLCVSALRSGFALSYYNLGIRGETSQDILNRWQEDCALRFPVSCDARVVFSFGANDAVMEGDTLRVDPERSCQNLIKILETAKQKYKVLMVGPPPIEGDELNKRIKVLSERYAHESEQLNIPYIETYTTLFEDLEYRQEVSKNDGAHPRALGYSKLASLIASSNHWWF